MRLLVHIATLFIMFLIGILFASMIDVSVLSDEAKPLFFNELEIEAQTKNHDEILLQQGVIELTFIQKLAMQLEKVTSSFFNFILQILYEFSRVFFSG